MPKTSKDLIFAGRGQEEGVWVRRGLGAEGRRLLGEGPVKSSEDGRSPGLCRVLRFSPDGRFFAFCDSRGLKLIRVEDGMDQAEPIIQADLPRTTQLAFSPQASYLATFQPYAKYTGDAEKTAEAEANLRIWDTQTGRLVKALNQRKAQGWAPLWSSDESVVARLVGSEVLFHKLSGDEAQGWDKYVHKFVGEKTETMGLSPGPSPLHFAVYKPCAKGQPGVVSLLAYPSMSPVAAKTFWKADRVSYHWNTTGTALIVMAITDVDSSGQSYYGEQTLYLISTKGDSVMVPLGKKGPIYAVQWSPRANAGFTVVYGYMPAKATLYNQRGEPIFDFGTGPRNECHYNAWGTILCLCGFGNLRGNVEFWSVRDRRLIKQTTAEDTTQFAWAPDGEHFITATTAPRLRVNNGWKLWHYTGAVVEEWKAGEGKEFWEAVWCPDPEFDYDSHKIIFPPATPPVSPSQSLPGEGQNPLAAHAKTTKKGAYVPPHLRGDAAGQARAKAFTIHDNEAPTPTQAQGRGRGRGANQNSNSNRGQAMPGQDEAPPPLSAADKRAKEIRNLQKKLEAIKVLKHRRECGEKLELNQITKIEKEDQLQKQLEELELS